MARRRKLTELFTETQQVIQQSGVTPPEGLEPGVEFGAAQDGITPEEIEFGFTSRKPTGLFSSRQEFTPVTTLAELQQQGQTAQAAGPRAQREIDKRLSALGRRNAFIRRPRLRTLVSRGRV